MLYLIVIEWVNYNIDLNNINLDNNFDEDDPDTIILSDFWIGIVNLKNAKHLKNI